MKKFLTLAIVAIALLINVPTTQAWEGWFSFVPEYKDEYNIEHFKMYGSDCVMLRDGEDNKNGNVLFVVDSDKIYAIRNPNKSEIKFTAIVYDRTGHYPSDKPLVLEYWFVDVKNNYFRISEDISMLKKPTDTNPYGLPNAYRAEDNKEYFPTQNTIANLFGLMTDYRQYPCIECL